MNYTRFSQKKGSSQPLFLDRFRFSAIIGFLIAALLLIAGCKNPEIITQQTQGKSSPQATSPSPEPSQPFPTKTPEPKPTLETMIKFDYSSVEDWSVGRLIFDLEERSFGEKTYPGVYELDLQTGETREISGAGTQMLDIAPDLQHILAAREGNLSVIDLDSGTENLIAGDYFHVSPSGAKWDHSANLIYYLAEDDSGTSLIQFQPESGMIAQPIPGGPISILQIDQGILTWGYGICNAFGSCTYDGLKWSSTEGEDIATVEMGESILLPCQTANSFVYAERDKEGGLSLHIRPHAEEQEILFWALNTEYSDCAWSPEGDRLAVTLIDRGWYSGVIQDYYFQILTPESNKVIDLSYLQCALDQATWSPDNKLITFSGTVLKDQIYQLKLNLLDLETNRVTRLDLPEQFQSDNYLSIHNIFWLP